MQKETQHICAWDRFLCYCLHPSNRLAMLRHTLRHLQQSELAVGGSLACTLQALHTTSAARWVADPEPSSSAEQPRGHGERRRRQGPGELPGSTLPAAGRQPQDALVIQQRAPLLEQAFALYNTAANAVNRQVVGKCASWEPVEV